MLSDGQRRLDLKIATENVAGDLEDLQAGGQLADGIDPIATALAIETTYQQLWTELTGTDEFDVNETFRIDHRLQRLHDLGFDAAELELYTTADGSKLRLIPRVVEHGFHGQRLKALTGLETGENQARRLLNDISRYRAVIEQQTLTKIPETVAAARWLDERFEPTIDGVPPDLVGKLRTGRALPPGAGASLVHVGGGRWRRRARRGRHVVRARRADAVARRAAAVDTTWDDDEWTSTTGPPRAGSPKPGTRTT